MMALASWDEPCVLANWNDIASVVDQLCDEMGWIFRGVASKNYHLVPGIGRSDARRAPDGSSRPFSKEREKALFGEFERQAAPLLPSDKLAKCDELAIAQHHGLRTRLLDWTESFLVSVFFAVDDPIGGTSDDDGYACIYALRNVPNLEVEDPLEIPKDTLFLLRPRQFVPRIVAQRGVFTVHGSPDKPYSPVNPIMGKRWSIRRSIALDVKRRLDLAGINRATLFPDLDGVAAYLSWAYKRDRLPIDAAT